MTSRLKKLGASLTLLALLLVGSPANAALLGASDFSSSLTSGITAAASSLTLVSTSTPSGEALVQGGMYGLKLGGREYVIGTLGSGKTFSSLTRGVSHITGTTTIGAAAEAWGRGTSVEITDAPLIIQIANILAGLQLSDTALGYATGVTPVDPGDLVDKEYVDGLAFSGAGISDATSVSRGIVELATGAEAAASTAAGGSGNLAIPASIATSTYNGSSSNVVVVTDGTNKIDDGFIPSTIANNTTINGTFAAGTTTISGSLTLSGGSATSNIASSTIQAFTASTTPTTTWTKPSNLKYVLVKVLGSGGGGAGGQNSGTDDLAGSGGGGGGYCEKIIPAAALGATETVVVPVGGTAGTGSGGGNSNAVVAAFGSHCTATNGSGGGSGGGAGGIGSGGDINLSGQGGESIGGAIDTAGGTGGSSIMGGGGSGGTSDSGTAGGNYGGGGGGGGGLGLGGDASGGAGAPGAVFVYQYFF